jgi:hypothetical protein
MGQSITHEEAMLAASLLEVCDSSSFVGAAEINHWHRQNL